MGKIIFLDIDGTLTLPGSNVPPESALEAVRLARKNGHKVLLCTGRNPAMMAPVYEYGFDGAVAGAGGYVFVGDKVLAEQLDIHPISEYDGRPIYKIVFMCTAAEQLEPARKALEDKYNFVVQDVAAHKCLNGELINRKFDKGRGVRIVADFYGADISDTIGFGDSMNDLEMIQTVGTSVCMDNGSPKLKEISDIVCPSVQEDGLYKAFRDLGII